MDTQKRKAPVAGTEAGENEHRKGPVRVDEHIVEIISDSGEGAQTAGQMFGTVSAKMGNSIWTVEIIPAEIEPPARSAAGASGNRIRLGSFPITNAGDEADIVVAFNDQVLKGREASGEFKSGAIILLESMWRTHADPEIAQAYAEVVAKLIGDGYNVFEVPMNDECRKYVDNPQRGKNMFVVGLLARIYSRNIALLREQIVAKFRKKGEKVIAPNVQLLEAGYEWAKENVDFEFEVPPWGTLDLETDGTGDDLQFGSIEIHSERGAESLLEG